MLRLFECTFITIPSISETASISVCVSFSVEIMLSFTSG